jgi:hypothetical protein
MQGLYSLLVLVGAWTVARDSLQGSSQLAYYTQSGGLSEPDLHKSLLSLDALVDMNIFSALIYRSLESGSALCAK